MSQPPNRNQPGCPLDVAAKPSACEDIDILILLTIGCLHPSYITPSNPIGTSQGDPTGLGMSLHTCGKRNIRPLDAVVSLSACVNIDN
jgi:hypothetical protein